MLKFTERLKELRKEKKITQKQMAKEIPITERVYQSYEYGKIIPSAAVLTAIAEYLDVSIDYLMGRTDNRDSHKL